MPTHHPAPMRLALVILAALIAGCSSTEPDEPTPAGLVATVDGQTFRASVLLADVEPGAVVVTGAVLGRGDAPVYRAITLFVPTTAGAYTTADGRASAFYAAGSPLDSTLQTWSTIGPGASLDLRVTDADAAHVEGTFAFTAVGDAETPGTVVVTGGTFNVGIGGGGRASVGLPSRLSPAR